MSGKAKLIAISFSGLVIAIGTFAFMVKPALSKISTLATQERDTRVEIHTLEQQIIAFNSAQADIAKATNKSLIYSTIVTDKTLYIPIKELEAGAKATGVDHTLLITKEFASDPVQVGKARAGAPVKKNLLNSQDVVEIPYSLTAKHARYGGIVTFIKYLEHLPHFTEITRISMNSQAAADGAATDVSATIEGLFVVRKDEVKVK